MVIFHTFFTCYIFLVYDLYGFPSTPQLLLRVHLVKQITWLLSSWSVFDAFIRKFPTIGPEYWLTELFKWEIGS